MPIPSWFTRTLYEGDTGPDVRVVRRKLGMDPDGPMDRVVIARILGFARKCGYLFHDGCVDEIVAARLGEAETVVAGLLPEWFALRPGDKGRAVAAVAEILGVGGDEYTPELALAVRRRQSAEQMEPTGIVDPETARALGEL